MNRAIAILILVSAVPPTDKHSRRRKAWPWLLGIAALLALAALAAMLLHPAVPASRLGEWENVHDWRKLGKCIECHAQRNKQEVAAGNPEGKLITPAKYHTEEFRRYTHGRTANLQPQNCASCHERSACDACHARMPESHVSDFTKPRGDTPGAQAHALYGRERPSSCLVCHKSFVTGCTGCHGARELIETQQRARAMLGPWSVLLEEKAR